MRRTLSTKGSSCTPEKSPVTPFLGGAVGVPVPSPSAPLLSPINRAAICADYSSAWLKCQALFLHSQFLPLPILLIFILSIHCRRDGKKTLVEETGILHDGRELRKDLGKADNGIWDRKIKRTEKGKKKNLFSFNLSDLSFNSPPTQPS